ncbi:MAG: tetratricopeptide repeat protein [Candidatus Riflebacteria bacterium]|nr:tetratricopeptide repeat protein [Candidatus Riflebacteria bacterium]
MKPAWGPVVVLGLLVTVVAGRSGAAEAPGAPATVGELIVKGRYQEARAALEGALKSTPDDPALLWDLARVLHETGRWDEAVPVLDRLGSDPRAAALAGEMLFERGEHEKALAVLKKAGPDLWAQAVTGLVHRSRGQDQLADQLFTPLVQTKPDSLTKSRDLWALAVAAREMKEFQSSMDALTKAQEVDPQDWRARVLTGELFASKYQINDGLAEYEAVLKQNPTHPDALAGKSVILAQTVDVELARELARKALSINPMMVEPHLVIARICEREEDLQGMLSAVEAALSVNPRSLDALATRAACHWLRGDRTAYEATVAECLKSCPTFADLYWVLGESCARRRRVVEAESFYRKALAVDPELAEAETSLGNLFMREGREEEARGHLEKSFDMDRYNYRTLNIIKLLDYMEKDFSIGRSPHFVFKVDEAREGFLTRIFLPVLEGFYPDLLTRFRYQPSEPIIIELFPRHDWFAARIEGTPWIGITGACFGKVIAAESPRVNAGSTNSREVLRHEITHAVNLQQSQRRLPMWLAEGLAVQEESGVPVSQWDPLLKRGLAVGDILPLSRLNSGFTRAKNAAQRQLAYYQASLAVADLRKSHGQAALLALIGLLEKGADPRTAFETALKVPFETVEARAMDAWKAVAAASPVRAEFALDDLATLQEKAAGGGAVELANFALACMQHKRHVEAHAALKKIVQDEAGAPAEVLALAGDFLMSRSNPDKAALRYQAALGKEPGCYHALMGMARIALASRPGDAEPFLTRASAAFPDLLEPHEELRKIHRTRGDQEKELAQLKELARLQLHKAEPWMDLAALQLARKDAPGALKALDELIFIDTANPRVHEMRARALETTGPSESALDAWTIHYRLRAYPCLTDSKPGQGWDVLKGAIDTETGLRRWAAILASGQVGCPEAAAALSSLMSDPDGESSHKAALALGQRLDARAAPTLIQAIGCSGPGRCGERALEALRRLAGRGFSTADQWRQWLSPREKRPRQDWVLESLEEAGYKARWDQPKEELPTLLSALGAKDWWIRENAWLELSRTVKRCYGRGAFGPHPAGEEPDWEPIRKNAAARFQAWWEKNKERF